LVAVHFGDQPTPRQVGEWNGCLAELGLFVLEFGGRLPNLKEEERNIIIVINVGFTQYAIA